MPVPWRSAPDLPFWSVRARRILSVVMLGTLAAGSLAGLGQRGPGERAAVIALLAAFTAFWVVLMGLVPVRESGPRRDFVLVVGLAAAGLALQALTLGGQAYAAAYFTAGVAPLIFEDSAAVVLATVVALAAATITSIEGQGPFNALLVLAGAGFFYITARAALLSREATLAAIAEREAEAGRAATAERSRIARELHDVLAHTLSGLSVQLEATRLLAERRSVDRDVIAQLERAQSLAGAGLDEARRAVGALRETDDLPGPDQLDVLVRDFTADTGVPCHLTVEGVASAPSPAARVALYRTAQEALTNVRRHARPDRVDVVLIWSAETAELSVTDVGCRPNGTGGRGFGLRGMRERAELAGGMLTAGPTSDGWAVRLTVPA